MLSSTSSLSSSIHSGTASSSSGHVHVNRVYKQASQLFMTRRVTEALQLLDQIIHPPTEQSTTSSDSNYEYSGLDEGSAPNDAYGNGSTGADGTSASAGSSDELSTSARKRAPVATASRAARVKVWTLYISILNSIVELDPDEAKAAFGASRYNDLVKSVGDGSAWDDIVQLGYNGNEAAVDADVVYNLSKLLFAKATSQKTTQSRLESYLASTSTMPNASALASQIERSSHSPTSQQPAIPTNSNGTSTPRDLGSRLKLLEIYVLHVLPANEEWEYAKEFVNMSEVLDEERREAFLTALESLKEERSVENRKEQELAAQRAREQAAEEERKKREAEAEERRVREERRRQEQNRDTGKAGVDEVDYGVDKARPNGIPKSSKPSNVAGSTSGGRSTASNTPAKKRPRETPPTLYKRASLMLAAMQQSLFHFGSSLTRNPVALIRAILFTFALAIALARRDVRDRLKRVRDTAWDKVKQTVGMGVKVSYL